VKSNFGNIPWNFRSSSGKEFVCENILTGGLAQKRKREKREKGRKVQGRRRINRCYRNSEEKKEMPGGGVPRSYSGKRPTCLVIRRSRRGCQKKKRWGGGAVLFPQGKKMKSVKAPKNSGFRERETGRRR